MSILIISTYSDIHAVAVHWGLAQLGWESTFWDWEDFPNSDSACWTIASDTEAACDWRINEQNYTREFSAIWYRRPAKPMPSSQSHPDDVAFIKRESTVFLNNSLPFLSMDKARWINHPADASQADNKMWQLTMAKQLGFIIPATLIGNDATKVKAFFAKHGGKIIYKGFLPNTWSNTEGGITAVCTSALTQEHVANDFAISGCPGIYQALIEKAFEVRVTIMNDTVLAAHIDSQINGAVVDWRAEIPGDRLPLRAMILPPEIEKRCLALCRRMNLAYCAIDLLVTHSGEYVFLEVNESGQFLWKERIDPSLYMLDTFCRSLIQRAGGMVSEVHPRLKLSDWYASESCADFTAYLDYRKNQDQAQAAASA